MRDYERMGGFVAKSLADAAACLRLMTRDEARVWLSFPAAIMATGARGAIVDLVRSGRVHAIITTCGTLDHDLARTWGTYHHGSFQMDDADLHERGMHRLGSVLVPSQNYGELLEQRLREPLRDYFAQTPRPSTRAFCEWLGSLLAEEPARDRSLLWACREAGVPVYVPGPTDGAVGSQVWMAYQRDRKIGFDLFRDEQDLSQAVHEAARLGALILGGGISKHHLIWWAQFRGGLDYAVAVTTAPEYDGSLSGARLREAVSWGKLKSAAKHVTVDADATLVLPWLVHSWLQDEG